MGAPKVKTPVKTTAKVPTRQDYSKLYDSLRTVPFTHWQKANPEDIAKAVKTPVEDAQALVVAAKIAYQTDKGRFIEYMMMGEVPPLKLKDEEMLLLKGGKGFWQKALAVGLVAGGIATLIYVGTRPSTPNGLKGFDLKSIK